MTTDDLVRRRKHRPLWLVFHTIILCAGIAFAAFGSVPVIEVAGRSVAYIWGGFFITGSVISLTGAAFRRYGGELVGLPVVAGGIGAYVVALWLTAPGGVLTRIGLGALLAGLVIPLWIRWRDLDALSAYETEIARP